MDALKYDDILVTYGLDEIKEEIETWKEVYGVDERYKAKLCGENDGKYWLTQVLDEWKEDGRLLSDFLRFLRRSTQKKFFFRQ